MHTTCEEAAEGQAAFDTGYVLFLLSDVLNTFLANCQVMRMECECLICDLLWRAGIQNAEISEKTEEMT